MLDLDERINDGLRELASRAPLEAEVWPTTGRYVAKRRRTRRTLASAAMTLLVVAGGLVTVGLVRRVHHRVTVANHAPNAEPPLALSGPIVRSLAITASPTGGISFAPDRITLHTGVYALGLVNGANAQHTLYFDDPSTLWSPLTVNTVGEEKTSRIFFGEPGEYTFYCAIAGHRLAGMEGVVHVTGEPMTLEQAEAAATGYVY